MRRLSDDHHTVRHHCADHLDTDQSLDEHMTEQERDEREWRENHEITRECHTTAMMTPRMIPVYLNASGKARTPAPIAALARLNVLVRNVPFPPLIQSGSVMVSCSEFIAIVGDTSGVFSLIITKNLSCTQLALVMSSTMHVPHIGDKARRHNPPATLHNAKNLSFSAMRETHKLKRPYKRPQSELSP
jgi:hypothetical protein